jgi:hypothetical protein
MPCEDYPCCGHGPAPMGDGGGCPDSQGRFNCAGCGRKLARNATSALCARCRNPRRRARRYSEDGGDFDYSMNY